MREETRKVASPGLGSVEPGPEQLRYAAILEKGMLLGLGMLLVTFVLYAFGIMGPYVPMDVLVECWTLDVGEYLHQVQAENGWGWTRLLGYGDFLNFLGIAVLSAVSILCYLLTIPILRKNGDNAYVILAIVQVLVLCAAASGLLGAGGH